MPHKYSGGFHPFLLRLAPVLTAGHSKHTLRRGGGGGEGEGGKARGKGERGGEGVKTGVSSPSQAIYSAAVNHGIPYMDNLH